MLAFISYARDDLEHVRPVLKGLREGGIELWVDVDHVAPGDEFPKEIGEALRRADVVIVFLSPTSVTRPWVLREIGYASRRELRVIPVEVEPVELPPELELEIGSRQRVPIAEALDVVLGNVKAHADDEPPNLKRYLDHLTDEWGHVPIDALVKDRAVRGIKIEDVYVSLATHHPGTESGAMCRRARRVAARANEEQGPERIEETLRAIGLIEELQDLQEARRRSPAVWPASDSDGPQYPSEECVSAALRAVGFGQERIDRQGLVKKASLRLGGLAEPSGEAVLRALRTIDLEDALYDVQVLLVEGAPESGKSTTLQHLAISLAVALRPAEPDPARARRMGFAEPFPIPLFVPLRRFASWLSRKEIDVSEGGAQSLVRYLRETVEESAEGANWVDCALDGGRLLLLLDGLDEVAHTPLRRGTAKVVRDFAKKFKVSRIAMTSRPSGLGADERTALECIPRLVQCQVLPLDDAQRSAFVRAWYGVLRPSETGAQNDAEHLLERLKPIDARNQDRELTRTPVTLVAICIVHAEGELPELRAELYERCVRALCGKLDARKIQEGASEDLAGTLDQDQKLVVLQALAFDLYQQQDEDARVDRADLLDALQETLEDAGQPHDTVACEQELERLTGRTGILVPDGEDDWKFLHKTFFEYLTARHICHELDGDPAHFLGERLHDPWWKEVVLLAVAHAKSQGVRQKLFPLVRGLKERVTGSKERQAAAIGTLGQAMLDLRAYRVRKIKLLAGDLENTFLQVTEDKTQIGNLGDRVAAIEAMGLYREDPRIGWTDAHFPLVEAGPFVMGGTDKGASSNEKPVRNAVQVAEFRIGKYPVTAGQLAQFVQSDYYRERRLWRGGGQPEKDVDVYVAYLERRPNHPATQVSWFEAMAYAAWLNEARPREDGWRWRLPTEAEWEKAARGGETMNGKDNPHPRRVYPWGDAWNRDWANSREIERGLTPIGAFPAADSPYGTVDQAGNIWEWCLDIHDAYDESEVDNPYRSAMGKHGDEADDSPRVCRGGSWDNVPH